MGSFGGEAVGSSRFPARNAYAQNREAPPRPVVGDPTDPQGIIVLLNQFLDWLRARNKKDRMVPIGQPSAYIDAFGPLESAKIAACVRQWEEQAD